MLTREGQPWLKGYFESGLLKECMTDKIKSQERSREEKVKRLQELMDTQIPESWLVAAQRFSTCESFQSSYLSDESKKYCRTTWDVHTGVAFTKLYKALR